MNQHLQTIFSTYKYAIPVSALFTALFLYWQKKTIKHKNTQVLDNTFIARNSLFVALLAFLIIHFNQPIGNFEDGLLVTPYPV